MPKAFSFVFAWNPLNIFSADLVAIGVDATGFGFAVTPGTALAIKEEAVVARRGVVNVTLAAVGV